MGARRDAGVGGAFFIAPMIFWKVIWSSRVKIAVTGPRSIRSEGGSVVKAAW